MVVENEYGIAKPLKFASPKNAENPALGLGSSMVNVLPPSPSAVAGFSVHCDLRKSRDAASAVQAATDFGGTSAVTVRRTALPWSSYFQSIFGSLWPFVTLW